MNHLPYFRGANRESSFNQCFYNIQPVYCGCKSIIIKFITICCIFPSYMIFNDIIFTKFIHLVEGNYKRERRVGWYAEQLCITPKYLSETVKQVSRLTPNEWIDNYVILEIRVLLKNSTRSIKEIAMEMNFPNQSFLGKFFKERVGMSPSEYRKG